MAFTGATVLTNSSANTQTYNLLGLVLAGSGTQTIAATSSELVVSSTISGSTGLNFTGIRTTLNNTGTNTYTGITTVSSGALNIQDNNALGGTAAGTIVSSGAALELQAGITVTGEALTINGSGTGSSNGGALRNISGTNTYAGVITLGSSSRINSDAGLLTLNTGTITGSGFGLTVGGSGNTTIGSVIGTAAGSLTKDGVGMLTLSGSNTYTGSTSILSGTLSTGSVVVSGNASGLGNASSAVTLGDAATKGALSYTGSSANYTRGFTLGAGGGQLDVTAAGQTLTVSSGNVTSTSGTFTIGGAGDAIIASTLTLGTGGLIKQGAGTLTLSGTNTYSGSTAILSGTLATGSLVVSAGASGLGSGGSPVTLGGAATEGSLSYTGNTATYTRGFALGAGGGQVLVTTAGQTLTIGGTGNVTSASGTFTLGGAGNTIVSSTLAMASGGLVKEGTGTATLSAANTYTGPTTVSAGVLNVQNATALGTTAGGVTVANGAALELQGDITVGAEALSLNGSGVSANGALRNISGTNTYGGLLTLAAAAEIQSDAGLLTLSNAGTITGATFGLTVDGAGDTSIASIIGTTTGGVTKTGAGRLTLSAASTYTGTTTVSAGVLRATTSTGALGSGTLALAGGSLELANDTGLNFARNTIVTASGTIFSERLTTGTGVTHTLGTLSIGAQTLTLDTDATVTSGTAGLTFGAVTLSAGGATFNANAGTLLTLGSVGGGTFGFTVGGTGNTNITGVVGTTTGGLTKTGNGRLTLSAANTYTGSTSIQAGTLSISATNSLGNATTPVTLGGASTQGTLAYTGTSVNFTRGFTVAAGGGRLDVTQSGSTFTIATGSIAGTGLFTVGGAGNVTVSSTIQGISGLTMAGSGTLTLSATNTYGGTTTVNSGVLRFGASNVLSSSSSLSLAGGTLDLQGFADTVAGFALSSGNVIGTGTLSSTANYTMTSGTISAPLGGTVGLVQSGAGLTILSAANSFSGTTAIHSGTISVASLLPGAVNQPLGTAARLDLGVAGTSSGRLLYTGGSGTLSKNVFALGNGTDTIQNAGTGLLTLSGTLTKNGTVLRLWGGTSGILVTGTIAGSSANSDLAVQNGLTTLSAANTYTGPTFVNSSGTLALGISNAIPSNSAVTLGGSAAGGNGGPGVLQMGSFTNAIGGLAFAGSGGTIAMVPTASATSTVILSATGAVVLNGAPSTLDLTGFAPSQSIGLYRLVAGTTLTSTFATVTGLTDPNFVLRYGTVNANELDLQRKANQNTTFTMTTGSVTRALVNTNVAVSGTLTNSSPLNSTSLTLGLASTGLTGSAFTTGSVTAGSSVSVSGSLAAGSIAGTQNWTITNSDANAITTTATATGSLQVVNQRVFGLTSGTVALGRYLITSTLPTGTTGVTSSGSFATTATGSLGAFSSSNGLTLSLTGGSANFDGTTASQTAGYTLSGSATQAGLLAGSFSSTVTAEFGSINPVVVNYTANPVNQRVFSTNTGTIALGPIHQGGSIGSSTLVVTSTGANATTANATLGSFTGGPSGFTLGLTSGSAQFTGASSPQSTTYTLSGTASTLGAISGTYSSAVTAEFGSIPNVTLAVNGNVYSGLSTWATNGGGSWGTVSGTGSGAFGANWGTNQGSPGLDAAFSTTDTATFGSVLTGGTAVILLNGATPSLKGITFDNSAGTYDLDVGSGGTGRIILAAGGTSAATIDVLTGFHEIHTELQLGSNLAVSVAAASGLTLHAAISGSTFALTKTGAGLLTVRGNNAWSGGTLITGGTLALGNSGTPLGSGSVVLTNNSTLDMRGYTIGNTIDATYGFILNPAAANIDITGTTTVSSTGAITGVYTVKPNGVGTFTAPLGIPSGTTGAGTITVQGGGSLVTTSTITSAGTVLVNAGGQASFSGPVDGNITTAGATTFGDGLLGLADVTVSGGTATFAGTTLGDVNVSGTAKLGATAIFTGTVAKTAHAYASGTISLVGAVAASADVKAATGGVVQILGTGSFAQPTMTNDGLVVVNRTDYLRMATAISGSGALEKYGSGTLELAGANTFTGQVSANAGKLLVNGALAAPVNVAAGATLGGSGTIGGFTSIAGIHAPGNSPGLQTFAGGLTYGGTSTFQWELAANTASAGDRGVSYDGVDVTGGNLQIDAGAAFDLIFNGAGSTVDWSDPFWSVNHQWTAIAFAGLGTSTGNFTIGSIGNDINGNPIWVTRPEAWFEVKRQGDNIVVAYSAPEPGAISIAAIGLGILGWRFHRRLRVRP